MKKKFLGRVLTMLLVASMVFTLLPAPAIAAGNWWWNTDEYTEEAVPTAATDANYHYNIFFLDCGRKYYSVASIKQLIDNASATGFNYIQLAVGNDGLRFLLNDMSLTVGTTTYTDKQVSDAIHKGNEAYYNFDTDELTQSEMDTIIAYAQEKHMGVIPCVNTPGHMDAILSAATSLTSTNCSYNGSARTIDVTNETAVAFTQALLQKYITYFAGKGCQLFNMGADEYANDIYTGGSMGFGNLQSEGMYSYYVNYVNQVAAMIKTAGMKPMAFNDGIYFKNNTSSGTFDTDIIICYWSSGWSSYSPMPAATLDAKGFKLVNTHGDYYWVLGGTQCDANKASGFNCKSFPGSTIDAPAGSMFCIWADYPGALTEKQVIDQTAATIDAFGKALPAATPDTTTPTPTPPDGGTTTPEPITITVGGTATKRINGHVYDAGVKTEGSSAEWTLEQKSETTPGGDQPVSEDKLSSTFFYIKRSDGKYFTENAAWTDNIKDAAQWQTVQQNNASTYILKLKGSGDSSKSFVRGSDSNAGLTYKSSATKYSFDGKFYYEGSITGTRYTLGTPVVQTEGETKDYTVVTFTGKSVGTTYVTIGGTKYTIIVVPEDLNNVTPLSIEYWITNGVVQRSESDTTESLTVSANMDGIATPDGVEVTSATMIPQNGYRDGRTVDYWQCRLLDTSISNTYGDNTQKQTEQNGDDETTSGVAFTKVRYYGGSWAVYTEKNEWVNVESKHQLVAYYMEHIQVTDEVDSHAADWGNIGDGRTGGWIDYPYCTLSVQVVYEDGTKNPVNEAAENLKAKSIVYGYWAEGRGIGTVLLSGNRDFEIVKVTAKKGTVNATISNKNSANITKFEWNKDETAVTVWEDEKGSMEASVHAPAKAFNEADKNNNLVWTSESQAILLRVYVRAKVTEDSLTVNYYDESNLAKPFYNYNIAVANGTYFDSNIALNSPWKGNLKNGTVTNIKGVKQTVSADLSTMPAIDANYRYMEYTCNRVEKITDEVGHVKTVNLYYTFTNKVTFVADFGLPIRIPITEINDTLKNATINEVTVRGAEYGTVSADKSGITYTPTNAFGADAEALQVSVKGQITVQGETGETVQKSEVTYQVYILHASNVLYEENFLTQSDENGRKSWTESQFGTAQQQTQKLKDAQTFGYDTAYANVTSAQGYWTAGGLTTKADSTRSLTTNFYGNAIDVIGSCGPKTGIVMVSIKNATTGKPVTSVVIETTYTAGTIDQVPLAHIELGEGNANYTAVIRGYAPLNAAQQQSGSLMLAADYYGGSYDALAADLAEMGLSLSDVEFIRASGAAAKTASTRRAAQSYALETVAEGRNSDNTVTIDGFRVYRSANNEAYKELINEYQVTYRNILKVMEGQFITAYVDNGTVTNCEVSNYEKQGGPQNEIYLQNNQTIAFKLLDSNGNVAANREIQISLSAVSGATQYNNINNISSTMEMYYTLKTDEYGIVTITNTGDDLLAIGNVKVPAGCTTVAPGDIDTQELVRSINLALNAAPETPDTAFDPAISAKVTTTRFIRSKVVTLTVSASSDVAVLKVNGVELRPTNSWLVKMGWSDTYTYILTEKVQKNEIKTYEIVGYRADGAASAPIVVKSK